MTSCFVTTEVVKVKFAKKTKTCSCFPFAFCCEFVDRTDKQGGGRAHLCYATDVIVNVMSFSFLCSHTKTELTYEAQNENV